MLNHALRSVLGAFISGSLMLSSTVASASVSSTTPQASPWAVLSALSDGTPAATVCSSTACALPTVQVAQADQQPPQQQDRREPPPPPAIPPISAPAASGFGLGIDPLILGLLALAAGVGIYLAVHHHNNNSNSPA